jgi:hypothetical protein
MAGDGRLPAGSMPAHRSRSQRMLLTCCAADLAPSPVPPDGALLAGSARPLSDPALLGARLGCRDGLGLLAPERGVARADGPAARPDGSEHGAAAGPCGAPEALEHPRDGPPRGDAPGVAHACKGRASAAKGEAAWAPAGAPGVDAAAAASGTAGSHRVESAGVQAATGVAAGHGVPGATACTGPVCPSAGSAASPWHSIAVGGPDEAAALAVRARSATALRAAALGVSPSAAAPWACTPSCTSSAAGWSAMLLEASLLASVRALESSACASSAPSIPSATAAAACDEPLRAGRLAGDAPLLARPPPADEPSYADGEKQHANVVIYRAACSRAATHCGPISQPARRETSWPW